MSVNWNDLHFRTSIDDAKVFFENIYKERYRGDTSS